MTAVSGDHRKIADSVPVDRWLPLSKLNGFINLSEHWGIFDPLIYFTYIS